MIIDFKEIPQANRATGEQDKFELFAREFLAYMEYNIVEDPSRGADGGKDFVVEEQLKLNGGGMQTIRWLVSCKHNAHSGNSVTDRDEQNVSDRVLQHKCDGFIGFYSTLPSTALSNRLHGIGKVNIYDSEKIERYIIDGGNNPKALSLFMRFFPNSWQKYLTLSQPAQAQPIFSPNIVCDCCKKDLFANPGSSIYVMVRDKNDRIIDVRYLTKGECDELSSKQLRANGYTDYWGEFCDLLNPQTWRVEWKRFAHEVQQGKYSDEGFRRMLNLLEQTYALVARKPTVQEQERYQTLKEFGLL